MSVRRAALQSVACVCVSSCVTALLLATSQGAGHAAETNAPPVPLEDETTEGWSFSPSVYTYIVPHGPVYAQPTLTADHGRLHLEARYNYEALETGSAWVGYNFSVGDQLSLELTPLVGGVFGKTTGVAPGYKFTVDYWKLELYSEGEYVFDTDDHTENFAYTWSELTLTPLEWVRFGLVGQRTRAYQTDVDIQRGLLLGFSYRSLAFTTYVFNLDQSRQTVVLALGVSF